MATKKFKEGLKFDSPDGNPKNRFDLLPAGALCEVAEIFTYGAGKYEARNWELGMSWGRVFGATMRHLWAYWGGEENDPESGKCHLAHACFGILVLLEYRKYHRSGDDRSKLNKKG